MSESPLAVVAPPPDAKPLSGPKPRHGLYYTYGYKAWARMKERCDHGYENYGGRGIGYDSRWTDFREFHKDMGACPKGLSLGRRDNNDGYHKDNCRWETREQQNRNRRVFKNSTSGLAGVSPDGSWWRTRVYDRGIRITLYKGKDFFEACCARKSWEVHYERSRG